MAPPFTVPCEGRETRFYTVPIGNRTPGPCLAVHYTTAAPCQLHSEGICLTTVDKEGLHQIYIKGGISQRNHFFILSFSEFNKIYERLDIQNLVERGESFYQSRMKDVVTLLDGKGGICSYTLFVN